MRLRIGVIGLGRLWEARHRPSIARLGDRFRIAAAYDQVARLAALEAARSGCHACDGVAQLIERPDVDAVYLLSPQWFGLYALHVAAAADKPVYCAVPTAGSLGELESLPAGAVVVPELARRFDPATLRLRELMATALGPPRLVLGQVRIVGDGPTPLLVDPIAGLLDWCRFLFNAEPIAVGGRGASLRVESPEARDFEAVWAEFPGGALAQINASRHPGDPDRAPPDRGFQVVAERGNAWIETPGRLRWVVAGSTHEEVFASEPTLGEVLNDQFHRHIGGEPSLCPTLADAIAVARLVDVLGRPSA